MASDTPTTDELHEKRAWERALVDSAALAEEARNCWQCRLRGAVCEEHDPRVVARRQSQERTAASVREYMRRVAEAGADVQIATGGKVHGTGRDGDHILTPSGLRRLEK